MRFIYIYKFSKNDMNKYTLLVRKGMYPCQYTDDLKTFIETSLAENKNFYNHLNMD